MSHGPTLSAPDATRERILDALAALAGPHGLPDAEAVARSAGVGRSTLYRHFGGVDAMLAALAAEATARGAELVERHLGPALRGEPGAAILDGLARAYEAAIREDSRYRRVMRHDPAAAHELHLRFTDFSEQVIRMAQRRGEVQAALDPRATATALVAIDLALLRAVDGGETGVDGALMIFDRFLAGLRA